MTPDANLRSWQPVSARSTQESDATGSPSTVADEEPAHGKGFGKQAALRPNSAALNLNKMSFSISSNYREHDIDCTGVRISTKADPLNPLVIGIGANTIGRVQLRKPQVEELKDVLYSKLMEQTIGNNDSADERDIKFMANLFGV